MYNNMLALLIIIVISTGVYEYIHTYHCSFEHTINRSTIIKLAHFVTTSPSLPYSNSKNCTFAVTIELTVVWD